MTSTSDGSIWVNGGNEIQKITSGGVVTQYPVPSGRSVTALGVGSDGDVWFTELQHCPPQCYKRRMFGKITLGGTITEYNYYNHRSTFIGEDMVMGHDGALYTIYGAYGKMLRILPNGTTQEVDGAGVGGSTLIAGPRGDFYTIGLHAALYEGGPNMSAHFLQQPPNGPDARDLVLASDGNIWITQQNLNSIAVYLRHQIRPVPTSISVGVGNSQSLSISETKYDEGWQVVSSNPSIASVSMVSMTQYNVTGVSTGSCSIVITDTMGNQRAVPVTVN
jgi:streptogramin lyase